MNFLHRLSESLILSVEFVTILTVPATLTSNDGTIYIMIQQDCKNETNRVKYWCEGNATSKISLT
jgi:hypothetical protein